MKITILCVSLILSGVSGVHSQVRGQSTEILDVEHADADFAVQGEYSGTIEVNGNDVKLGVQVIADGDGKFRSVGYSGGLPGDGWNGLDETKFPGSGEIIDGVCFLKSNSGAQSGEIRDGILTLSAGGNELGELNKVKRKSPTLGAEAPNGAVVLFDGSNADNFVEEDLLDDNLLKQGATSRQKFGSYKLHLEFMLSYSPKARGQRRSNSGCYHQGRYEVQILDSFGLEGVDHECGGIYKIASPAVNMCLPPLSWQTYDVEFQKAVYDQAGRKTQNARITVLHNGVKIHDAQELGHATTAYIVSEGPEDGPIYLQDHSNQVRFRNIWVQPVP
ncbi:MAG: DUF1080 domain-containing protein [Fuerstiella sp.]|nr:DUF1080 domain-containing protein [Fuerstiella sp.]